DGLLAIETQEARTAREEQARVGHKKVKRAVFGDYHVTRREMQLSVLQRKLLKKLAFYLALLALFVTSILVRRDIETLFWSSAAMKGAVVESTWWRGDTQRRYGDIQAEVRFHMLNYMLELTPASRKTFGRCAVHATLHPAPPLLPSPPSSAIVAPFSHGRS
ncbi:MAG: hypothetical protein ACK4ZJ_16590, partial [Allorhizobium sp.]